MNNIDDIIRNISTDADSTSADDVVHQIKAAWDYFEDRPINEKIRGRFYLVLGLQRIFSMVDPTTISNIITAIGYDVHAPHEYEYPIFPVGLRLGDVIPIRCKSHGQFSVRLIDHLMPGPDIRLPIGCLQCLVNDYNEHIAWQLEHYGYATSIDGRELSMDLSNEYMPNKRLIIT